MEETTKYIELSQLQDVIKRRLSDISCWVRAEVSSYQNRNHHYFEFVEKAQNGGIAAKVKGVVWSSAGAVITRFERAVGQSIAPGMTLVMCVKVNYHAEYGLSLQVLDIDPAYTLGERELQKQNAIRELTAAGLIDRQRRLLRLPLLPGRIAVISSQDAAGFGDFTKHLAENAYGFVYDCTLFHSVMQGEACPASIVNALNVIESAGGYDIVLILRGGGADSDMFCFDDKSLCERIAKMDIPVLSAVGHEKDYHICDMVSLADFKTPTALANALIDWVAEVEGDMLGHCRNISRELAARNDERERELLLSFNRIGKALTETVNRQQSAVELSLERIKNGLQSVAEELKRRALYSLSNIKFGINAAMEKISLQIELSDANIGAADPRTILRNGYILATGRDGKFLRSVTDGKPGEQVNLRFSDGMWGCHIDNVKPFDNQ